MLEWESVAAACNGGTALVVGAERREQFDGNLAACGMDGVGDFGRGGAGECGA